MEEEPREITTWDIVNAARQVRRTAGPARKEEEPLALDLQILDHPRSVGIPFSIRQDGGRRVRT